MNKLLILDSNSIINRAYYGVRPLTSPDGTPTNGIYGFLNILMKLINEIQPNYIFAAFDLKAPTFRHKMYKEYKANRKGMPEDLAVQMPIMKNILSLMNIPILQLEGFEADDIIGTVSRICGEKNTECYIATGDRDDLQLAGNGTTVVLTSTKHGQSVTELFDDAAVKNKYGVTPSEFVDLKALMGDTSDNIPGVSGIGEKTAAKIISQFSTLEEIYEHIGDLNLTARLKNRLIEEKDTAFLSKQLAKIDVCVPIVIDFEKSRYDIDSPDYEPNLYCVLEQLGLKSIIKKLELAPPTVESELNVIKDFFDDKKIKTFADINELNEAINGKKNISVYIDISDKTITSFGFSDGTISYCSSPNFFGNELLAAVRPILESDEIKKYVCEIKNVMTSLSQIDFKGIEFDCAIAAYLINPAQAHDIDSLGANYLGIYIDETENAQLSLLDDNISPDKAAKYALMIHALHDKLSPVIEENNQNKLFYEVEMPLIKILASMQILGFTLDSDELKNFGNMLSQKITEAEKSIYQDAGEIFNINSPKQLGVILFEKLGLKGGKKTKNGYSTRADILEKLSDKYDIVKNVLQYRTYMKLKSTYCDSLGLLVNPHTHRIHSVFHQMGTVTGRLSSSEPNMQNIPTRTELGRELRKMFTAKKGCMLIDADYSQIELRVLAHLSQDPVMIDAFASGADIHAVTASKILGIPIKDLTKEQRSSAKAINFGIVYGMGEYTLAQDLGISYSEAKAYMNEYFNKYSGVRLYLDNLKSNAHKYGYVKTLMNRIRYIPEIQSSNVQMRNYGERIAMNTPVQGTAADIIKLAMVLVYNKMQSENLNAKLILQVHDELIIETPLNEIDRVKEILKHEMENAVKLDVPLTVDMQIGKSWYDTK